MRKLFAGADLHIEDLYLLESFQIEYLPGWVPERELALVLWAHPLIDRFLRTKSPAVSGFLDATKTRYPPAADRSDLARAEDVVVWTIADMIVYNKCPELYDGLGFHGWDFAEVTSITPLDGKVVVDVGAGTGRVALEAATTAHTVFAVEPVARLRQFIREKTANQGRRNVHVLDGLGHAIPLPDGFADVVITSHALGWSLEEELAEFERVAMPGMVVLVEPDRRSWGAGTLHLGEVGGKEPTVPCKEGVRCRKGVGPDEKVGDYPLPRPAGQAVPLPSQPRLIGHR